MEDWVVEDINIMLRSINYMLYLMRMHSNTCARINIFKTLIWESFITLVPDF